MFEPVHPLTIRTAALEPHEEWRLVQRAQTDRRQFGRLYDLHARAVLDYLARRTGDHHVAEDLASEAFVRALQSLPSLRFRGVPFRHWLLRIAANLASKRNRSERVRATEPIDEELEGRARTEDDGHDYVRRALDSLAPRFATLLSLHHVEGLSVDELARLLGCRPGTVQSRLHRGRLRLQQALTRERERHEG
jgi:RNA polymerase sigma-70 factor (ECF subfamily)